MDTLDGPGADIDATSPMLTWISQLRDSLRAGQRPTSVTSPLGSHNISYHEDDFCDPFALVGLTLPDDVYPDIHGTHGELTALRIYYDGTS